MELIDELRKQVWQVATERNRLELQRDALIMAAQEVLKSHGTDWRCTDGKLHRDVACDCPACTSLRDAITAAGAPG